MADHYHEVIENLEEAVKIEEALTQITKEEAEMLIEVGNSPEGYRSRLYGLVRPPKEMH